MDGKSLAAVLLVGGIVLYYLSKSKGVDATMLKYQQKQIDDASVQGKLLLVSDTGERFGWIENTDQGTVPVVPTGSTPEQEKEAIRIFDQSLTIVSPAVDMPQTGSRQVGSYLYETFYVYNYPALMARFGFSAGQIVSTRTGPDGVTEVMTNAGAWEKL